MTIEPGTERGVPGVCVTRAGDCAGMAGGLCD